MLNVCKFIKNATKLLKKFHFLKILGHKIVKIALFSIKITNCLHISFFFTNFAAHFVNEALTLRLCHEKPRFGRSVLKHGISSVSRRYLL